jgi:hypothetical protein
VDSSGIWASAGDNRAALTRGDGGGVRLESEDDLLVVEGKGPDGDDETKLIGLEVLGDMSIAAGGRSSLRRLLGFAILTSINLSLVKRYLSLTPCRHTRRIPLFQYFLYLVRFMHPYP